MAGALELTSLVVDTLRVRQSMYHPDGVVGNSKMDPTDPIDQDKFLHRFRANWSQKYTDNAATERRVVYRAARAGILVGVNIGSAIAATVDATATITIKKNGVAALTSSVVLDNANTAFITEAGAPSGGGAYVTGDVFEVEVTAASAGAGALPKGLFVDLIFDEGTFT